MAKQKGRRIFFGFPKDVKCSMNVCGLVSHTIGIVLSIIAMFLPEWYVNEPLDMPPWNYPYRRRWGLLIVQGRKTTTLVELMNIACETVDQVQSQSGINQISQFYMGKCASWEMMMIVSFITLTFMMIATAIAVGSMICSLRQSARSLRYSVVTSFISFILMCAAITSYGFFTNRAFISVSSSGRYPHPMPGSSYIMCIMATVMYWVATMGYCFTYRAFVKEKDFEEKTYHEYSALRKQYGL